MLTGARDAQPSDRNMQGRESKTRLMSAWGTAGDLADARTATDGATLFVST